MREKRITGRKKTNHTNKTKKKGKEMKKLKKALAITVLSMSITTSMGIVTWADTTNGITSQTDRWEGTGDSWKLLNESRNGYVVNSWFQDLDGSWYMLGSDGQMFSGLVTDQSTGKSYLLNTNHDGTYGRMLTTNGTYTVNGKSVYLTFNQAHDGSYGAILSGLSEARSSGVAEVTLPSIPTDSSSETGSSKSIRGGELKGGYEDNIQGGNLQGGTSTYGEWGYGGDPDCMRTGPLKGGDNNIQGGNLQGNQ